MNRYRFFSPRCSPNSHISNSSLERVKLGPEFDWKSVMVVVPPSWLLLPPRAYMKCHRSRSSHGRIATAASVFEPGRWWWSIAKNFNPVDCMHFLFLFCWIFARVLFGVSTPITSDDPTEWNSCRFYHFHRFSPFVLHNQLERLIESLRHPPGFIAPL